MGKGGYSEDLLFLAHRVCHLGFPFHEYYTSPYYLCRQRQYCQPDHGPFSHSHDSCEQEVPAEGVSARLVERAAAYSQPYLFRIFLFAFYPGKIHRYKILETSGPIRIHKRVTPVDQREWIRWAL